MENNQSNEPNQPEQTDLMGYEGQVDTEPSKAPEVELPSSPDEVQKLINDAVKEVTVDPDTGKYIYPEDMNPMLKAAVAATKSYRDTQSGFTKNQQKLKELEAEREALRDKLAKFTSSSLELAPEARQELEELKQKDPEAWRVKLNQLEQEAKQSIQEELDGATEEARQKASAEYELQRRYEYLDEFNSARETPITEEMLNNDIPPRISKKLADGKVSFEEFLAEAAEFIDAPKKVAKPPKVETTDLSKAGGSAQPSGDAGDNDLVDYSKITF